jgi:hypothetical protein
MNLKMRLERLCESRSWARLHFADGTAVTGRVIRVGHDYLEIESYGDPEHPAHREYAKYLIPLGLVKYLTIESNLFAEAERHRLTYLSESEGIAEESLPELEK